MTPNLGPLAQTAIANVLCKFFTVLGWAHVNNRHGKKLLAAIAVVLHRGVVHRQKLLALNIDNPHGHRIVVKQQAERFFALLQFSDVDANADTSAIGGAALLDSNPAVA